MAKIMNGGGPGGPGESFRVDRLAALLLTEQRGVDPAGTWTEYGGGDRVAGPPDASGGDVDREHLDTWLAAAAALAAGEPKRALAVLGGLPPAAASARPGRPPSQALTRAMRAAALAMDTDWQPGGYLAPLRAEPGTPESAGPVLVPDERLRLCTHLAGQFIPVLLSARMTLGHATTAEAARERASRYGARIEGAGWDVSEGIDEPLKWYDGLYEPIAEAGHEEAAACHLLLAADLRVRAGDREAAVPLLHAGLRQASRRPAATGLAELLRGDWELGPPGLAEQCVVPPTPPSAPELDRAAERYGLAEAAYRAAGSQRGRAAALLRLAHVHRLRGETEACRTTVAAALAAALAAGDGACAVLLRVHQALDLIAIDTRAQAQTHIGTSTDADADADIDIESGTEAKVAAVVVGWGGTVGSASWVRGLARLVQDRADAWSAQGYIARSGRATSLARLLAPDRDSGPGDREALPKAGTYAEARHRLAAVVLTDLEQRDHLERIRRCTDLGEAPDITHCLGVIQGAQIFHSQASALRDPDLMAAARLRIERALDVGGLLVAGTGAPADGPLAEILDGLRSDLAACPAQEALFRSRRSRSAGLEEEADRFADEAVVLAGQIPQELFRSVVRCAALADLGRWKAARAEVRAVEARLPAVQAAGLWARLGRPGRARGHVPRIGVVGTGDDHSWESAALHAELALAEGAYGDAADQALRGLAAYEEHRLRLARDTLRASFADDPVPAGLHHAATLALLLPGGGDAPAAAFTQAERGRAGFLGAVRALDAAGTDREDRTAVRNWLAAEVRWAAEFEEHVGAVRHETAGPSEGRAAEAGGRLSEGARPQVTERRMRIGAVDRALDAAEAVVRRRVPAALTAGAGEPPDAAAVAEALPPDTVLLAYHLFGDSLVGWAMTRERLLFEHVTSPPEHRKLAHDVVATARRFRDWCAAAPGSGPAEADGRRLAEWLLRPFAAPLRDCPRVIVVPPATLALLPFHALPWHADVLGATHEVSYLPAAAGVTRRRSPEPDRPWNELRALLVGAPATDPRRGLPTLPGTAVETAEIARLLPRSRLLTGAGATRAEVLAAAPGHDVLHLAAHGLVDELAPNRSRLPLAGDDALGLADLLSAAHGPRLLVLSACDTGRGRATAGGDVLGLTRAALITGARHTVVSLWPVHDSVGCLVITRMYRHLVHDPAPRVGAALALAQREVRALSGAERDEEFRLLAHRTGTDPGPRHRARSWAPGECSVPSRDTEPVRRRAATERHPYYWAPFIHVGV
ncbi:CHAT domain-containing protein [Streptomyces sp. NBC_01451]|uniref:CHAT domain-containing protein n=1 Tax=Streptomyces sp. NBC_01451 TaxID=2903872 RepID=UPI002E32FC0E|nr:CHAT domain-containing protein [Streptomyces sp. NBC_01451]